MFTKKQITQPIRIGDRLKKHREAAGLSITELAERTKLHTDSIHALETCAFHHLPKEIVYQKLYIKRYATGVGVDPTPLLEAFVEEELQDNQQDSYLPALATRQINWLRYRPTAMSLIGTFLVIGSFGTYIGMQMNNLYSPPTLILTTPEDGNINETGITTIAGVTDPEVSVFINGEQVRSNTEGGFSTNIDLQPGVNTIFVSAKKRHGSESNITKHVLYRETSQVTLHDGAPQLTTN
jgi:transcriptional regulator with XRE-family HTH domain